MTGLSEYSAKVDSQEQQTSMVTNSGHSYLLADCGRTNTIVILFDYVAGSYRFIARGSALTTTGPPWFDVMRGFQQAIGQITQVTGRVLLEENGNLIRPSRTGGIGVDSFGLVTSAAIPHNAIVVGLLEEVSLASTRQALRRIYIEELDVFSLGDGRGSRAQIESVYEKLPNLVILSGGTDGGADQQVIDFVNNIAVGISMLEESQRPSVVFAGNESLRDQVTEILSELTQVYFSDNVRPELDSESTGYLTGLLSDLYISERIGRLPGMKKIIDWSSMPLVPTAQALGAICEYFASLYNGQIICLDIGSDSVTIIKAEPEKSQLLVRSDLGLGSPISRNFSNGKSTSTQRWMIREINPQTITDKVYEKSLHPQSIPLTEDDLQLEYALVREIVRTAFLDSGLEESDSGEDEISKTRLLLLHGGALGNAPKPGLALIAALDALQPIGVFRVVVDLHGVLPLMGLVAHQNQELVVQVLESGVLLEMGTVMVPSGIGKLGEVVLQASLSSDYIESIEVDVKYGDLLVIPLDQDQGADLLLQPNYQFDVGSGPGKIRKLRIRGGELGLIFDLRGRPIQLPDDVEARQEILEMWLQKFHG